MDPVEFIDSEAIRLFGLLARRSAKFDAFVLQLTGIDLLKGGIIVALLWWLWFDAFENVWAARIATIKAVCAGVAAAALSRGMQVLLPVRPRPVSAAPGFVPPIGFEDQAAHWSVWNSFPSDHAALFFALAAGIWLIRRTVGAAAFVWTLVAISLPRVYLGLHYVSDIAGGAALGVAIMYAVHKLPDSRIAPILEWEKAHRGLFYGGAFLLCYEIAGLFFDLRTLAVLALHTVRIALDST